MSTLIFGAGAIGQWMGALLQKSGCEVQLHGRARVAKEINKRGGISLNASPPIDVPFSSKLSDLKGKHFESVISTVKTYAVESVLKDLAKSKVSFDKLITFQNGWGTEALYREAFPEAELWTLTGTRAVGIEDTGQLTPSSKGGLALAPWDPDRGCQAPNSLRRLPIPLVMLENGRDLKWSKLILNLIGNASGAITGLTPLRLASHPELMNTELLLVRECLAVGNALGVNRQNLPGFPIRVLSSALEKFPLPLVGPLISSRMRKARGEKLPSLFFDLEDPKRPTEIDCLNGAVVKAGTELGIPTPKHAALTELFHRCRRDADVWESIRQEPQLLMEYV